MPMVVPGNEASLSTSGGRTFKSSHPSLDFYENHRDRILLEKKWILLSQLAFSQPCGFDPQKGNFFNKKVGLTHKKAIFSAKKIYTLIFFKQNVDFCQQLDKHVLEPNGSIASEG